MVVHFKLCLYIYFLTLFSFFYGFSVEDKAIELTQKDLQKDFFFQKEVETLNYDVSYLGVVGGKGLLKSTPLSKENIIRFQVKANTLSWVEKIYRLRLNLNSYSSLKDFKTIRYREIKTENDRYYNNVQYFNWSKKNYSFIDKKNQDPLKTMTINFKSDWGLNIVSALYFTRTIDFKVGKTYVFNCFFREKVFRAKVFVEEITTIKTKYGKKEVIVIVPIMKYGSLFSNEKSMKVYLSNDKYRVPMRVSVTLIFGSFIGNLVSGYPGEELK